MEEELQEQTARRNRVEVLLTEVGELSDHYRSKSALYDRITEYCTELLDDLLLIDHETLELSKYRRPVHEMLTSIETWWRKIELFYRNITRDTEWLQNNVDSIQPDMVELWWLMTEDVQRRLLAIRDYFLKFFELQAEFKEMVRNFPDTLGDEVIFEKYKDFSDW